MNRIEKYYRLMLPIVGVLCMIFPEKVAQWLPTILGSIMVITSITDTVFVIREKRYLVTYKHKASSLILFIMGICFLLGQESTVTLMGVTWGLMGLQEVNEEIEEILIKRNQKEKWRVGAVVTGFKLLLSLALLFEPLEKFNFHIFLLGMEILAVTVREKNIVEYVKEFKDKM